MIQTAGPKFTKLLHQVFRTLWVHEMQPAAWQMFLMQPIYKGGDKSEKFENGELERNWKWRGNSFGFV